MEQYKFSKPEKELAESIESMVSTATVASTTAGSSSNWIHQTWLRNLWSYYAPMLNASGWESALQYCGEQGELIKMAVPQARSLTQQFVTIVTKQRMAYECLADASDSKTFYAARLGKSLLEQTVKEEQVQLKRRMQNESAAVCGAGYLLAMWRTDKGHIYAADEGGNPVYSGHIDIKFIPIWDVFRHHDCPSFDDLRAVIVRVSENRWDLIAQFPKQEAAIRKLPSVRSQMSPFHMFNFSPMSNRNDEDDVHILLTFHVPTPAVPMGRILIHAEGGLVLADYAENPIEMLPLTEVRYESVLGSGLGYPMLSSLLPAQEMFDHCFSVTATNQSAFGVQNVLVAKGSDISVTDIGGLKLMHYKPQSVDGGGKPEALNLTKTPPEVEAFANQLQRQMELISAISGALRGAPPAGATSGVAIATLSANAVEFLSAAQEADALAQERLGEIIIRTYRAYASVPKMLSITSEQGLGALYVAEFKGSDLQAVKRVSVKQINPLMQSASGRLTMADGLLQKGLIANPQQYFGIIEGRPPETLWDVDVREDMAVQSEIDGILQNQVPQPLITDNHPMFIRAYQRLLYDRNFRSQSPLVPVILQVMQQRLQMEQMLDPALKAILRGAQGVPPQQGGPKAPAPGEVMQEPQPDTANPAEPLDVGGQN